MKGKRMVIKQLENLADHQKHLLIQQGKYTKQLRYLWFKKWNMEYPYWTDCNGNIK